MTVTLKSQDPDSNVAGRKNSLHFAQESAHHKQKLTIHANQLKINKQKNSYGSERITNLVVPRHRIGMRRCAVDLAVHVSILLNARPSSYMPSVILAGVSTRAGGAPATLSGVKRS